MVIGNGSIGVISIAILLAVTACGGVEDTPRVQEQGTASEALAPKAGLTYWDANGSVVNICWTNSGLASEKDRIRTALQSTWDAYSGLTFTWPVDSNTTCPHTGEIVASTYLPIFVSDSSAFGGQCNAGFGARLDKSVCGGVMQCQCFVNTDFDSALTERSIEYAAMHEVAHGLGMIHEHQRADRPTDIASWCTDTNPDPNKWTTNPNYLIEPSLTVTVFDRTASVTSYCYDPDNDGVQNDPRVHPGGAYPELGVLDKLGIEMLHPFNLTRVPVAVGGIGDATGTTYVVRSDLATALQVDWHWRGALPAFFSNVHWRDGGTLVEFSQALSPSLTVSGTKVVQVTLDDLRGRHHGWTGATLRGNNALFTSIVGSSSNYLLL